MAVTTLHHTAQGVQKEKKLGGLGLLKEESATRKRPDPDASERLALLPSPSVKLRD